MSRTKIQLLTGNGKLTRKPVQDGARSTKSSRSIEDPFAESASGAATRVPTLFENKLKETNGMPDKQDITSMADAAIPNESIDFLPYNVRTPSKDRFQPANDNELGCEADVSDLLSSSPLAQSTPRFSLLPAFRQDANRARRPISAGAISLNYAHVGELDRATPLGVGMILPTMPRVKKHPTPSLEELMRLETVLGRLSKPKTAASDDGDSSVQESASPDPLTTSIGGGLIARPKERIVKESYTIEDDADSGSDLISLSPAHSR